MSRSDREGDMSAIKYIIVLVLVEVRAIPEAFLQEAIAEATNHVNSKLTAAELQNDRLRLPQRISAKSSPESLAMEKAYEIHQHAVTHLVKKHGIGLVAAHRHVRQATTTTSGTCPTTTTTACNSADRYRTIDGSCNNLANPTWGMAGTDQERLILQTFYCNGDGPRGCGTQLPNPCDISAGLHFQRDLTFKNLSNMCHQWGQFLDHDCTSTPEASRNCCSNPNQLNCFPIADNTGSVPGRSCVDLTRSTSCVRNGKREQMNSVTSFIDGSQVYGSKPSRAQALRAFVDGKLLTSSNPNFSGCLPNKNQTAAAESSNVRGDFIAGDDRINEMPGLVTLHNLVLREHNRIAAEFRRLKPTWTDEKIYQETRRIIGALLQCITYREFLPCLIAPDILQSYGLGLILNQPTTYNPNTNPTILNEFSTVAFRCGHTLLSQKITMINEFTKQQTDMYSISDEYFQSRKIIQGNFQGYDDIMTGLYRSPSGFFDPYCVDGVRKHLFREQGAPFGSDLMARNIQRGRDHGLPPYYIFRQWCGLPPLSTATNPSDMDATAYREMLKVYNNNINDIDAFTGGCHEFPYGDGACGYTFQRILAEQFYLLLYGDRYFFTSSSSGFTLDQIKAIFDWPLCNILCASSQRPSAPANPFKLGGSSVPCSSIAKFNMSAFLGP